MSAMEILKFFISDILTASVISALFLWISNNQQKAQRQLDQKTLQDLKDHIDLRLQIATLIIQKEIVEQSDANELS